MLPTVRVLTGGREACEFLWHDAEAYGPVDPTCWVNAALVLVGPDGVEKRCCLHHALYELAISFCREIKVGAPQPQIHELVRSLEAVLTDIQSGVQRTAP